MSEPLEQTLEKLLYETDGTARHILDVAHLYGIHIALAAARDDDLDAAWAEAEAALPADKLHELRIGKLNGGYWADGWHVDMPMTAGREIGITTEGATPAAALRALTAKLREAAA